MRWKKDHFAVFPGLSPTITRSALATYLKQYNSRVCLKKQVLKNSSLPRVNKLGYNLVSGGTDNHLV
jgi:glycine/serine hydroxymethyltransferase